MTRLAATWPEQQRQAWPAPPLCDSRVELAPGHLILTPQTAIVCALTAGHEPPHGAWVPVNGPHIDAGLRFPIHNRARVEWLDPEEAATT